MTHSMVARSVIFAFAVLSVIMCHPLPETRAVPTLPEAPREWVDTKLVPPTGRILNVKAGDDLQDALEMAQLGDVIVLEAGATFIGPFTLPDKGAGSGWITIRTSTSDRDHFPSPGTRVNPSHAPLMPKLTARRGDGVVLA